MRILIVLWAAAVYGQPTVTQHLNELAETGMRERSERVAGLTKKGAEERRAWVRERFLAEIGGLPAEHGPLHARVTGSFTRPGYRVENLVYESLPGFYVTANVYVPLTGKGPYPALVGVAGHSANGKASATYQHVWISLARRGFVVVAIDPPGQGERSETLDAATGLPRAPIGTGEHILTGTQALLTGGHFAKYEIWDGVRAVDYLLTRADVDAKKIAVAGNSGGGTQAAYLAVADPRLAAAVSSCYMTSWKQLWYKPGPQDAEQVFPGFLRDGLDFGDFAFAAAPKPFLMTTAIQDFFPILGARNTYGEIKRFYALLDAEVKAGYFEYDDTHGWSKPRREAAYRWLSKWLAGREDSGVEGEVETEPEQNLYVTATGQVQSSLGGETTQSLNAKEALRVHGERTAKKQGVNRDMVVARTALIPTRTQLYESRLEMPAGGPGGKYPAVIALNALKGDVADLVSAGYAVMQLQTEGPGAGQSGYSPQYQTASRAMLVGRTVVGLQLSDVMNAYTDLAGRADIDSSKVRIYGRGNSAVTALHATYLLPQVQGVALEAMPVSWLAVTQAKMHRGLIEMVLPGVLRDYDLPDLARAVGAGKVWVVDARSPMGVPLPLDIVKGEYPEARVSYRPEGWSFAKVYRDWISGK